MKSNTQSLAKSRARLKFRREWRDQLEIYHCYLNIHLKHFLYIIIYSLIHSSRMLNFSLWNLIFWNGKDDELQNGKKRNFVREKIHFYR